jgi:hypothetical protein
MKKLIKERTMLRSWQTRSQHHVAAVKECCSMSMPPVFWRLGRHFALAVDGTPWGEVHPGGHGNFNG